MMDADSKDYIMCAGINPKDNLEGTGLIGMHAYTVIGAKEFDGIKLVLVRNPHGRNEWSGDWSDNSDLWTAELKEGFGFTWEDGNDGLFWISMDDFYTFFDDVSINEFRDDVTMEFTVKEDPSSEHAIIEFRDLEAGTHTFSTCQIDKRSVPRDELEDYKYGESHLIVFKTGIMGPEYINGHLGHGRDSSVRIEVDQPGSTYGFLIDMQNAQRGYSITRYGPGGSE